jgi:hypothetical protein
VESGLTFAGFAVSTLPFPQVLFSNSFIATKVG